MGCDVVRNKTELDAYNVWSMWKVYVKFGNSMKKQAIACMVIISEEINETPLYVWYLE